MIYKKIYLNEIVKAGVGKSSYFEIYSCEHNAEVNIDPRPVMIVCPGGGYAMCSYREAEPIALRYLSEGFNCIVLNYSVMTLFPTPQFELAVTINYIKKNALNFNMNPNCINLVGFSAGAHLIASYSLYFKEYAKDLGVDKETLRPFSLTMGYAVTSKQFANNSGSFNNLSLSNKDYFDKFDIIENLTNDFPPTYIWTTRKDGYIDPLNSILLAEKFKKLNIHHKFSLFEEGIHGGSLFNHAVYDDSFDFDKVKNNKKWVDESVEFIFNLMKK